MTISRKLRAPTLISNSTLHVENKLGWKKSTSDAFGNLVQMNEPNPVGGGADYVTTYTYNNANQLTGVSMPRGASTQTRSFTYDVAGRMLTETHPETGTTTYTWNPSGGPLATKTDAKGQRTQYVYDTVRRLVLELHYDAANVENLCERVTYAYDGGGQHTYGRLWTVGWGDEKPSVCGAGRLTETYDYDAGGRVTSKELKVKQKDLTPVSIPQRIDGEAALAATWTYNANGQMSGTKYPDSNLTGPTYNYGYDTMLRIAGMTQVAATLVNDVLYGPAGEMTQWRRNGTLETRSFNIRGQVINIHQNGALIHEYRYAALSDGRAIAHKNWVSGEDVQYTYDSLGRLKTAVTAGPEWGQSFGYDGFGNLLSKSVVKGSAPALSITVDPATNRINGQAYDANGNMTGFGGFDMKNRLATASGWTYGYDTANRRVWKKAANGDLYFDYWAPSGEKLGGYKLVYNVFPDAPKTIRFEMVTEIKYFAGRKLELTDQLGSQVATHPYGEERTVTANDTYKFATYFRDANGLDYAVNRYYSSVYGRFLSSDPYLASGGPANPGSWNRYAYVEGDPVNNLDPSGHATCAAVSFSLGASGGEAEIQCTSTFGSVFRSQWIAVPPGDPRGPAGPAYYASVVAIAVATLGVAVDQEEEEDSKCRVSLFAQSAFVEGSPLNHTYLSVAHVVNGDTHTTYLEGVPIPVDPKKQNPVLDDFHLDRSRGANHAYQTQSGFQDSWYRDNSVCDKLFATFESWENGKTKYNNTNPFQGPNSNSFTHGLLNAVNLHVSPFRDALLAVLAPGWSSPVRF